MSKSFRSNIWKAYIFNFLTSLHFLGGVLIPFFTDWGGISFFQITILQSWFVIWSFLLEIPTGAVADFWGRKTSLVLGCAIYTFGILIYTSKPDFLVFLLGEFLLAFACALLSGAYEALVYDSLKAIGKENQSKKIFGRCHSFKTIGFMAAAPLGSLIGIFCGLRWAMLLMVIPLAMASFLAFSFKEPRTKKKKKPSSYLRALLSGVKYFYSHKTLRVLALDGVSIAILCSFIIWIYQLILKQLNISLAYFGIIHAILSLSELIILTNFERLEKIFGSKKKYLFISAVISGIAFVFLGINIYVVPAVIAIAVAAGFGLTRFVLISNYMQKHIESHNRATVLSAVAMLKGIGMAISYPLVGLMVEWSVSYTVVVIGLAIVIFSLISRIKEADLID